MTQPSEADKTQPNRSGAGFGTLLALLIAAAAAIASYWTWQQSHIRDEVQDDLERGVAQLLTAIEQQRKEINQNSKIVQQQIEQHNALQQQLIALESTVEKAREPLKADHWTIAEAIYLINIAEHQYRLGQNSAMARSALERARVQLYEHRSSGTAAAIEEISRLIERLEQSGPVNQREQIAQLGSLAALIPVLPIIRDKFIVPHDTADSDYSLESLEGWSHYKAALWRDIQQLVRISRPDAPDSEKGLPITADIYPILRQQLALKIEFTRLALMSNSPLYITSIREIIEMLGRYFDRESEVVSEQLATLEQMVTTGERARPDIDFAAIRQLLAQSKNNSGE